MTMTFCTSYGHGQTHSSEWGVLKIGSESHRTNVGIYIGDPHERFVVGASHHRPHRSLSVGR